MSCFFFLIKEQIDQFVAASERTDPDRQFLFQFFKCDIVQKNVLLLAQHVCGNEQFLCLQLSLELCKKIGSGHQSGDADIAAEEIVADGIQIRPDPVFFQFPVQVLKKQVAGRTSRDGNMPRFLKRSPIGERPVEVVLKQSQKADSVLDLPECLVFLVFRKRNACQKIPFVGQKRCSEGRTLDVTDVTVFKNGYGVSKFSNFTTDNSATSDATFPDMHTFMMRKAEAYLTYAEALTRLAGGSAPAEALNALNIIRDRAHAAPLSNASLQTILDEWGREFYFEGRRRVDLIRFGKFGGTTDYKWQWKGGVMNGRDFQATRNVFAIPKSDIIANKNLVQNPGY